MSDTCWRIPIPKMLVRDLVYFVAMWAAAVVAIQRVHEWQHFAGSGLFVVLMIMRSILDGQLGYLDRWEREDALP